MKWMATRGTKRTVLWGLLACFLLLSAVNLTGDLFGCKYISVTAAVKEADRYEVRAELLQRALEETGVSSPEAAARLWAEGVKTRNGAMQYAAMGEELRKQYAGELSSIFPNWVTGVSSPWVTGYAVTESEGPDPAHQRMEVDFSTATSTGPYGTYRASLAIGREGDFWRVTGVLLDRELYAYTGFQDPEDSGGKGLRPIGTNNGAGSL